MFLLLQLSFVFSIYRFSNSDALTVLEAESELAEVNCSILHSLSSPTLWEAVVEPSFVNVCITRAFAILVLQNSTEAMEVLRVNQDLALVNVVVVLSD